MIEIDAIIFDLDGTLIDSKDDIAASVNRTLEVFSRPPIPPQEIYRHVGAGVQNLIEQTFGRGEPEAVVRAIAEFKSVYRRHLLDTTRLFEGVDRVLDHFAAKRLAILTNKPSQFTFPILDGLGISGFFSKVLCGDSVKEKKPSPQPVLEILAAFGAQPPKALVCGDGGVDIEAGRAAGTVTCGAAYGYRPPEEIAEADVRIERPIELLMLFC